MGILEDFLENAKSAAIFAGEKAEQLYDISKLKITETNISCNIKKHLKALGMLTYKSIKNGTDSDTEIRLLVEKLDELYTELYAVRELIKKAKSSNTGEC